MAIRKLLTFPWVNDFIPIPMIKRTSSIFILFLLINILSLFYIISSASWIALWVGIELNLYSFIFLLVLPPSQASSPQPITSRLIYFIVQAIGSLILITGVYFYLAFPNFLPFRLILLALLVKIGAAPFHFWIPWISLNCSWPSLFWLLTFQKLPPLFFIQNLLASSPFSSNPVTLILLFSILSAIFGGILGLFQTRLQALLAYSSINQSAWFLITTLISSNILLTYYLLYSAILLPICYLFFKLQTKAPYLNLRWSNFSKTEFFIMITLFLNLAGIPPLAIFSIKITVFFRLANSLSIVIIFIILILRSSLSTFFYLQYLINAFISPANQNKLPLSVISMPYISPFTFISLVTPLILFPLILLCINSLNKTYDFHS